VWRRLNILNNTEDPNLHQQRCEKLKPRKFCIIFFLYMILLLQLSAFPLLSTFFIFPIFAPSFPLWVPYLCPQKPYPSPPFSQPINSHLLAVTMTSRASDLWLSVLDCNDHGSSVCLSGLGMLIDPQNINATVQIIKCSDSNMELGSAVRIRFRAWVHVVLFVQNHTYPYRLTPNTEFSITCSDHSQSQQIHVKNRIKENSIKIRWNRKEDM
jgi:hypothetical protein